MQDEDCCEEEDQKEVAEKERAEGVASPIVPERNVGDRETHGGEAHVDCLRVPKEGVERCYSF